MHKLKYKYEWYFSSFVNASCWLLPSLYFMYWPEKLYAQTLIIFWLIYDNIFSKWVIPINSSWDGTKCVLESPSLIFFFLVPLPHTKSVNTLTSIKKWFIFWCQNSKIFFKLLWYQTYFLHLINHLKRYKYT